MSMAVVICLKNRTFAVSQTSGNVNICSKSLLWFAWKIVLLQYHKHPVSVLWYLEGSCDLLEKSYFCSITNIRSFKNLSKKVLWFAWKIVLLQYHKHLNILSGKRYIRCDLLEKSYFCSITNINIGCDLFSDALWFAWKIVLLQYHKHLKYHIYLYYKQIQRFKK